MIGQLDTDQPLELVRATFGIVIVIWNVHVTAMPVWGQPFASCRPMIYRRTKNLRAVQLLLGHSKLESTVRYLGIEVDDALEIAEQTEI